LGLRCGGSAPDESEQAASPVPAHAARGLVTAPAEEITQHLHWWKSVRIDRRRASP